MADLSSRLGIYDEMEKQKDTSKTKKVLGVSIALVVLVGLIVWKVVL